MRNSHRETRKAIANFFEWAEQQGYSLYDIARSLRFHYTTVYRIQKGQYVQRAAENFRARAIAAYGCDVAKIFSGELTVTHDNHTPEPHA